MALVWVGLAVEVGVVAVVVVFLLLAVLMVPAVVKGRRMRRAREETPPSPAKAHDNAVRAYESARNHRLFVLATAPVLVGALFYGLGVTIGAILVSAGIVVMLIGGIPTHRAYMAALREQVDSARLGL
jgi:hypothetical protein